MLKITLWGILSGVVLALLIFIALTSKSKRAQTQKKSQSLVTLISVIVFSGGATGAASYFLSLPHPNRDIPLFPSTGSESIPQTLFLYGNPMDGIVTFSLLISIVFLVAVAFRNIAQREEIEKNLAHEKTATRNALDNLHVEREKLADRVKELESLNNSMIGRELKMVELKKEIKSLTGQKQ